MRVRSHGERDEYPESGERSGCEKGLRDRICRQARGSLGNGFGKGRIVDRRQLDVSPQRVEP